MANEAASPLGDANIGDIGAALAAANLPASGPPEGAAGGGGAAEGAGQASAPRAAPGPVQSLDFILDIPLKVTVELGRSKMAIRDILQLAQGSVVELSKFAGEPLEVLINDKLIARGEVVVVNEKFGIRLTDIISPVERIEQLK
ncbi:MAG TPA: flagellar motor switch protein FliN [Bdellovibrionota bacterium]|nr:flagellar motor switch protein FliN [Bdellovibrionota bacterium]